MNSATQSSWPFVLTGVILLLGAVLTSSGHVTHPASRLVLLLGDVVLLLFGSVLTVRRRDAPWQEKLLALIAMLVAAGAVPG